MKKEFKIFAAVIVGALFIGGGMTSCMKLLEYDTYTVITPDDVEDSDAGAEQLVRGAYNGLHAHFFVYNQIIRSLEYDHDYVSGAVWQFSELGSGNFQGNGAETDAMWTGPYGLINRVNYAVSHINSMQNLTDDNKKHFLGELYFLKAWSYFMLVRAYGDVPVYRETVVEMNEYRNFARVPIKDVYAYIIELLDSAKDMMYKNTDAGYANDISKKGRVCAGSAAGLLAKVYATMGSGSLAAGEQVVVNTGKPFVMQGTTKVYTSPTAHTFTKQQVAGYESFNPTDCYTKAHKLADDLIKGEYGTHTLLDYDKLWSKAGKTSNEILFSLQSVSGSELYGTTFSTSWCGRLNLDGFVDQSLTLGYRKHWYLLFEPDDFRIELGVQHRWVRQGSDTSWGGGSYYPPFGKYKDMATGYYDPVLGEDVPPQYPYNDGRSYRSDEAGSEQFFAFTTKYLNVTDRTQTRMDADFPLLRMADIYLILAEAENELNGPTQLAVDRLNDVRTRSNASVKLLTDFADKVALRSAVIEERVMELSLEGDRRWDLIRWGIYLQAMNALGGVDEVNNVKSRSDKHLLYPIPQSEMLTNGAINENNPGWI